MDQGPGEAIRGGGGLAPLRRDDESSPISTDRLAAGAGCFHNLGCAAGARLDRVRIIRASGMADQELSEAERAEIRRELERLREEHRDLDAAIEALDRVGATDRLQMQRLKKRKLALRDKLTAYEDMLTPDIIA
jgi:hypothetical protein